MASASSCTNLVIEVCAKFRQFSYAEMVSPEQGCFTFTSIFQLWYTVFILKYIFAKNFSSQTVKDPGTAL